MNKTPIKIQPGDEMHLSILMVAHHLDLLPELNRQRLLAYGRAAFDAGRATAPDACGVTPTALDSQGGAK